MSLFWKKSVSCRNRTNYWKIWSNRTTTNKNLLLKQEEQVLGRRMFQLQELFKWLKRQVIKMVQVNSIWTWTLVKKLLLRLGNLIVLWKFHLKNCNWANKSLKVAMELFIRLFGGRPLLLSKYSRLIQAVTILSKILSVNVMQWRLWGIQILLCFWVHAPSHPILL